MKLIYGEKVQSTNGLKSKNGGMYKLSILRLTLYIAQFDQRIADFFQNLFRIY